MAAEALNGTKWELVKSENFDNFMKAIGVGFLTRKVGNSITNYEEWTVNGDSWSLAILSTFKNKHVTFKLGEEYDDETLDGRKVKTTFTLDGNKLVQTQKGEPHDTVITREVAGNVLTVTYTLPKVPDLTCIRTYNKMAK